MTTFTIDTDNNITGHASAEEAARNPEAEQFNSAKQLTKLAETARLMLVPIVRASQHDPAFVPNNLLLIEKADSQ